jgi:hypothetical protein
VRRRSIRVCAGKTDEIVAAIDRDNPSGIAGLDHQGVEVPPGHSRGLPVDAEVRCVANLEGGIEIKNAMSCFSFCRYIHFHHPTLAIKERKSSAALSSRGRTTILRRPSLSSPASIA